jgi:hypothetical protein
VVLGVLFGWTVGAYTVGHVVGSRRKLAQFQELFRQLDDKYAAPSSPAELVEAPGALRIIRWLRKVAR